MKQPLVSVLMPAYNAEKYIAEAIESILNQTYKNFEFIIIDDCSTDKTWKLIQKYQKKDQRITASKQKENLYIAQTRNNLLVKAHGKYIIWQDADDISYPYRINEQVHYLEAHPNVGIIGGTLEFINNTNNKTEYRKYYVDDSDIRKHIFYYAPVAQPAACVRRECYIKLGNFDLKYPPSEDLHMSFRIGTKYKFANLSKILIKYRDNYSSATYKKLRKMELDSIKIRVSFLNSRHYPKTIMVYLYLVVHLISVFTLPTKIKIKLFKLFRNEK